MSGWIAAGVLLLVGLIILVPLILCGRLYQRPHTSKSVFAVVKEYYKYVHRKGWHSCRNWKHTRELESMYIKTAEIYNAIYTTYLRPLLHTCTTLQRKR